LIDKINSLIGLPARVLGNIAIPAANILPLFIRLEYSDIDITSDTRVPAGSHEIRLRNEGKNERGVQKISVGLIK